MFIKRLLVVAFLTQSLDRQLSTLQQQFTFGSFEINIMQLIRKTGLICLGFVGSSFPFCIAYRFLWSQICFTSSFKFEVPSNISNGLAFSGMSNNMFASGLHCFALTNLDVRFHFNSATFFLSFQLAAHLYPRLHL